MAPLFQGFARAVPGAVAHAARAVRSLVRAGTGNEPVRLASRHATDPPTRPPAGVIVADDDSFVRCFLRAKLEAIGQDVFEATNGLEAVALASDLRAALIILDIKMPELDGIHACVRIRGLLFHAETPIVMLTGLDTEQTQRTASRAGATMFLAKPFASAALMLALSRFLPIRPATLEAIHTDAVRAAGGKVFRTVHT